MPFPMKVKPRISERHGGRRPGAGRPKSGRLVGVPHRARPRHDKDHPVHVTWPVLRDLPSLRKPVVARAIGDAIRTSTSSHARRRTSFRILHFSVQRDRVHLIIEAGSKGTLMRSLRGLGVWIARRVNEVIDRTGRVLADRYEEKALTTPREVRNAIIAVLGGEGGASVDEFSSARWFAGWAKPPEMPEEPSPVAQPRTWLARVGWRRLGAVRAGERPGA
jgi:REP element-mobilizing transposase RayT